MSRHDHSVRRGAAGVTLAWAMASLVACGDGATGKGGDDSATGPDTDTDTTVVSPSDTAAPIEELDPAVLSQVELAASAWAAQAATLDLAPAFATAERVRALEQGPACPPPAERPEGPGWWGADCTTSDGVAFFGMLLDLVNGWEATYEAELHDPVLDTWGSLVEPGWEQPVTMELSGTGYSAYFEVDRAPMALSMAGLYFELSVTAGAIDGSLVHVGGEVIDTEATGDTWVTRRLRPTLDRAILEGAAGGRLVYVDGSFDGLPTAYTSAVGHGLVFANAATGDVCGAEPTGSIGVRDPDGVWYTLTFDGDTGGPCDGCAILTVLGEPRGQACPDLSSLMSL